MKWIKAKNHLISLWVLATLTLCSGLVSAGSWQQNVTIGGFNNVHINTQAT